jgi:Fe-S-cluster containining protein
VAPRVRALSIHADYRCRNAGACCSSGWDIPVEPEVEDRLRAALGEGRLRLEPAGAPSRPATSACFRTALGLPHGARVVLAADAKGRCAFLEADRRCAVHRQVDVEHLPGACRAFPRIVTLTPLGVSVTLSHYCPTAAAKLFAEGALRVVEEPQAFPPSSPYDGLDARDALPPLLRPGVLMDWPSLDRWERFAVRVLADEERSPEAALDVLAAAAEEARRWTPEEGPFDAFFARVLSSRVTTRGTRVASSHDLSLSSRRASWGRARRDPPARRQTPRRTAGMELLGVTSSFAGAPFESGPEAKPRARFPADERRGSAIPADPSGPGRRDSLGTTWQLVADCVPHRALLPRAPAGLGDADGRWVAPGWPALGRPIRRWLAAKAFGSWLTLQGDGLRTAVRGLHVALRVLRAEAARGSAEAARALDPDLLMEAVRRADLLFVHLVDPEALARRLSRGEAAGEPPAAW